MKFNELELREELQKVLVENGFEDATEIQSESIPVALSGRDIIGQAQTGTGKTLAFCLPILNAVADNDSLQVLMLAPTRELAVQIANEIDKLTKYMDVKVLSVYGGDPIDRQIQFLKKRPQIVVGTPGRVLDLIKRGKLKLHEVQYFVLDEVDEMLNMGFIDDVELIASKLNRDKQTLFFSATMPDRIKNICTKFLNDPEIIRVKSKSLTVDKVDQYYVVCKDQQKYQMLKNIIDFKANDKTIIFTQTKRKADEVYEFLIDHKYKVDKIHGDLTQKQRLSTIDRFKAGKLNFIVATDVVARGIDIEGVQLVINLELPQDIEYYIHRIGRTGRGNAARGEAITIVTPRAYDKEFRHYERKLNCVIDKFVPPTESEIVSKLQVSYFEKISESLSKDIEQSYYDLADMFAGEDSRVVIAALLQSAYPELSTKKRKVETVNTDRPRRDGDRRNDRGGRNGSGRGGYGKGRPNRSSRDGDRRRDNRDSRDRSDRPKSHGFKDTKKKRRRKIMED